MTQASLPVDAENCGALSPDDGTVSAADFEAELDAFEPPVSWGAVSETLDARRPDA